jgi:tripartite-type tricarboxylate transporter receptor subunit TctC
VQLPELRKQFRAQGVELTASASPEECSAFLEAEFAKHNKLWKDLGLTPR